MPTRVKQASGAAINGSRSKTGWARNRMKLSTTVAPENLAFLESMVTAGRTDSISEAVDLAIARLRRVENRARLEAATAAYFDGLTPAALAEEDALARQLHSSSKSVDFDLEP